MTAIIDFFNSIIDLIGSLFEMISNYVSGIVWMVANLPLFIAQINTSIMMLPSFLVGAAVVCLALIGVFAIIRLF